MRKMKESGIQWIPILPDNWDVLRGKVILQLLKRSPEPFPEVITCFRDGEVTLRKNRREDGFTFSDKEIGYQGICTGDLVIHGMDGFAGAIGISDSDGKGSPVLVVCDSNENKKYLMYYLRMLASQNVFVAMATGIRERSCDLRWNKIADLLFPVPPVLEQNKIVNYLDEKCAKIDAIIEKQQAVIEKLKEYKLSVITEAVTKGLNPNAEMFDSDIEWIGNIPVYWKSIKLKYCTYIRARLGWKGLKADEYVEKGFPLLSAFNIVNSKLDFENNINYINEFRYDESPEIKLSINDILLVKDGAGIGKCAIVEQLPLPSTTNGSLAVISTDDKLSAKFLYYFFLSNVFQKYIDRIKDGMGVPHLFQSDLREIAVVVPCIEEQNLIVEKLNKITERLDTSIQKKEKIIEKLVEYKKSLIYEVITGKKEV